MALLLGSHSTGNDFVRRIALAFFVLVVVPAYAADDRAAIQSGRTFVQNNCSRCHAVDPKGKSRHPDAPPFRTLSKRYPLVNLEESLAEGISTGHPDMPEFQVGPNEISSIVRYLDTIQEK